MLVTLVVSSYACGQGGFIVHFDEVQAGRSGSARSVRETTDGFLVFSGQFSQQFPSKPHIYTRRLDATGQYEQEFEYIVGLNRGFDLGYIDAVATNGDGTYTAVIDEGRDFASKKMFYQFDQAGDTLLTHLIMTYPPEDSVSQAIRQVKKVDAGYAFCGFHDLPQQLTKAMLGLMDPDGDTLWLRFYGNTDEAPVALGVAEYVDGGFLLTGYGTPPGNMNKSFLIRTDTNGNQIWRRNYGNRAAAVNGAVRIAADEGIITWSTYAEEAWPTNWEQMMLTKWDVNGSIVWQKRSHYNVVTSTYDLEVLPDGSFIGSGTSLLKGVLAKFSSQGDSLWSRAYSVTSDFNMLYDVEPTSDGGFVATGTAYRYDPVDTAFQTNQVIWVVKTDSLGCVVPGCQNVGVREYALDMNEYLNVWPNPASDRINFSFTPPAELTPSGALRAVLLDATGRTVREEFLPAGGTVFSLPAHELPAGAYHLHLSDGRKWLAGRTVIKE